jgi:hypothetical protein
LLKLGHPLNICAAQPNYPERVRDYSTPPRNHSRTKPRRGRLSSPAGAPVLRARPDSRRGEP